MKRSVIREILWLFLLTRLFMVLLTYIAYVLLTTPNHQDIAADAVGLFTSWNHWDAANYVRIAQYGYQPFDVAFFPLFPLLIRCFSFLLGSWSYILVSMLISNAALLGSLFVLYRLAADHYGDEVALRTLRYLCLFPTALFFFAGYNESLYLLCVVGGFLALQQQRWWLAGLCGLIASLTRNIGILLVIPYLYELWLVRTDVFRSIPRALLALWPLALIPLGTALYALYCWQLLGNPLAFVTVQAHAGRHLSWPWMGIWHSLGSLLWDHPQPFGSSNQVHMLLNLSATIGFITLWILGWTRVRRSYSIWMGCALLYILLYPALDKPDALLSNQRFVLELFPGFLTLALLSKQHVRLHQIYTLLVPLLLAVLSIAFLMNRWLV